MKAVLGPSVLASLLTSVFALAPSALAQPAMVQPVMPQPGAIVQSAPPALAVERLNQNLNRLSRQPTDVEALIGAGTASYDLGDAQAANGFFTRANMVAPNDGRVKEGLGLVSLALKQPQEAATYFDDAERMGRPATEHMAERALAYDLNGQQDKAQRDYAAALRIDPANEELIRNYAVSLGISGRVDDAEAQLRPLLYKSDRAAWRDRTMILAMNGRTAEAHRIAQSVMPKAMADAMDPYLMRMGALTPAQKATAVHYGQFPADGLRLAPVTSAPAAQAVAAKQEKEREKETGSRHHRHNGEQIAEASPAPQSAEDSRLLAAMPHADMPPPVTSAPMVQPIPATPPPVKMATAAPARDTSGDDDPDGWTTADRRRVERAVPRPAPMPPATAQPVTVQPTPVRPAPMQTVQTVPVTPPARSMQPATQAANVDAMPTALAASRMPAPVATTPASPPRLVQTEPARPVAVAGPSDPRPSAPPPPSASAPASQPRTLAAIMADIQVPDAERAGSAQAVDLNEVAQIQAAKRKAAADKAKKDAAAKAKAEAEEKAREEAEEKARLKANPARIWAQIATGKEPAALAFDMRRLRKTYSVLADQDAYTAEWGQTRRLLVGPFSSQAKAKAVLTDLKKAGGDGFVFQSEAGEVVDPLSGK